MGLPPISFTGFSTFSDEFQVVLERVFEQASLPLQQLQTEQTLILSQQQALGDLAGAVQDLEQRFTNLGLLGATSAIAASSSNTDIATVAVTGNPEKTQIDITVTSAASAAQETSLAGLPDTNSSALSANGIYALTVGSTTTNFDLLTIGSGRTAGTTGAATPAPPVSVQVDFSNGVSGSISAELNSFFVAAQAPSGAGAGDTVQVSFVSADDSINESISTVALNGTETTADIANLLNDQIALNAQLNGKLTFSDAGGKLKLVVSDTAGQGFTFTSSSTGTIVSGLEGGAVVGGHSAQEIAAALNAQVALNQDLVAAGVQFNAAGGEVKVTGTTAFDITVTDNAQGTGFVSGLAGTQSVGAFDNTLEGLRGFINSQSSILGVKALIINTSSDPDNAQFRLNLTATETGGTTLTLQDSGAADLLTKTLVDGKQGTDAKFQVNGLDVTNAGNTIANFVPGLTLTIVDAGATTIEVRSDRSVLANALADVATDYNALFAKIQEQIGEGAGILSGNIAVRQGQQSLREVTGFIGSGDIRSMVAIGLELDEKGLLSFNSTTFNSLTDAQLQQALAFVGDTVSGFAGNARTVLKQLGDPATGQLRTAINFLSESDELLSRQISKAQLQLDRSMEELEKRFAEADRLLSQLESQQTLIREIFDSFNRQLDRF